MIQILADSPDDAALIAKAVGSDARIVDDPVRFANGGGHVECLILGCRRPIPTEKTELLRKIERDTPWVPVILVTDRAPEAARLLSDIRVAAVIWFADLRTELEPEIARAKQSIPLLRLAAQAEEAKLPPALQSGVAYSCRAATRQPVRGVKELAEAVCRSPTTLSEQFRESVGGTANLSGFLSALTVLKAHELRLSGLDWDAVAKHVGFTRQTLHNKSTRWLGSTLKQLARMRQAPLHAKFLWRARYLVRYIRQLMRWLLTRMERSGFGRRRKETHLALLVGRHIVLVPVSWGSQCFPRDIACWPRLEDYCGQ